MPRSLRFRLDAPPDVVRAAAERALGVSLDPDGSLSGPFASSLDAESRLRVAVRVAGNEDASEVTIWADTRLQLPYFWWFIGPLAARAHQRRIRYEARRLRAALRGELPPEPPRAFPLLPPVSFTPQAAGLVATVAAVAALANFGGALFGQNADAVTKAFHASNRELGFALAVSRAGVLVSLVASALADRQGRRRMLLICFVGVALSNGLSAAAPGFAVFTGAQLLTRAFVNAALVVAAIAVVEEAPDGARAYALAMLALAAGVGFAISVVLLPVSDVGTQAWRVAFAVSALTVVFLPRFARDLRETRRYKAITRRTLRRGRMREILGHAYRGRFVLLGLAAFMNNVFSAPAAQLTNRYLSDQHAFSNSTIALFRAVTNGLPGLLGIAIAGRLAESRGRRPVGILALFLASLLQIVFFLGGGPVLWVTSTLAIVAAASAGLALGAFDTELFPTEARGTSNALLLVCGVAGSATGLLIATNLDHVIGGLGRAIAICGIAPMIAAVLILPWLPEAAHRTLDEISPSPKAPPP